MWASVPAQLSDSRRIKINVTLVSRYRGRERERGAPAGDPSGCRQGSDTLWTRKALCGGVFKCERDVKRQHAVTIISHEMTKLRPRRNNVHFVGKRVRRQAETEQPQLAVRTPICEPPLGHDTRKVRFCVRSARNLPKGGGGGDL